MNLVFGNTFGNRIRTGCRICSSRATRDEAVIVADVLPHRWVRGTAPLFDSTPGCKCPAASLPSAGSSGSLVRDEGSGLSVEEFNEMGPIDYILVEWPGRQPNGEVAPHLVDLVDRGLIRILDLAFIAKAEDGSVAGIEIADVGGEVTELAIFEGASSGLLSDEDIAEAGGALEPGTSAALLVFENTWAAPFASAVRRSGGQLVASGRIPVQAVLAALDAAEA